ncbi:MAG: YraN family protein [Prevotellaceae bacterium]|nr:YraN family protein [Prevotellaceae bacterium]
MAEHNDRGKWGEQKAAEFLERKGFRIISRNWRDGHRDIDIVAIDADNLVIVEVKTRQNDKYIDPLQAVDVRKIRNLSFAANKYVRYSRIEMPLRFDIVTITGSSDDNCVIDHIEDAFIPSLY